MGCLLGANLGPTWRPRRLQDEPEAEKKGHKLDERSRFMLGAAQEEGYPIAPFPKADGVPLLGSVFRQFFDRFSKVSA